ncbi:uncharacterized protein G2W53_007585 [Senna tora]|uniref:Uncharacterized protein n=1 Tax=Senna tora TaxID=362788 RepID=A0A834X6J4_9FABA|nr:uncharacterized protein G2W53_007585 [Senna tora]
MDQHLQNSTNELPEAGSCLQSFTTSNVKCASHRKKEMTSQCREGGALDCTLLGGIMGAGRRDIEDLPADADRDDGVSSTKFRAN